MSTGFKYINARVLLIFLIALSITVAILVGERLVHFLEKAANGSVPPKAIFLLVAFRFSELLQLVIPFVLSISISISLGTLQESRELLSLQVAGLSNLRLLAWLSAPLLVLTVFVGIMSILATPSARQWRKVISRNIPIHKTRLLFSKAASGKTTNGRFITPKSQALMNRTTCSRNRLVTMEST